jgi:hypothetical protein
LSRDEISDPGVFRWVPTGVTGLARAREWDGTVPLEIPELDGEPADEFGLVAFVEEVVGPAYVRSEILERIAAVLDREVDRPYEALVVRRSGTAWAAGARRLRAELLRLPGVAAESLEVAVPPSDAPWGAVDGVPADRPVDPAVAAALHELERRGRSRFEAFVARADNLGGDRFKVTIDPL